MKKIIIIALGILVSSISYAAEGEAECSIVKNNKVITKGMCSQIIHDNFDNKTVYVYTSKKIGKNTVVERFKDGKPSYTLNNKPAITSYLKNGINCYKTDSETFCHGVFYDIEQGE